MNQIMRQMIDHASVRDYSAQMIERSLLLDIIRCGPAASSSNFVQACSVIRVTDETQRRQIADAAGQQRWVIEAAEFLVLCADLKRVEYCCEKNSLPFPAGYTEHFMVATIDAALMGQNMLLAAESAGLGGVFIGGIRNNPQVVADCLSLPDQVYPVFGLCLGWPARKMEVKPRLPVQAVLHEGGYQADAMVVSIEDYDELMSEYYAKRQSGQRDSNWSQQTASTVNAKRREHMLPFLQKRGFVQR